MAPTEPRDPRPDRVREPLPTCAPDGTDLSLIRWFLDMTPAQRLATLQRHAQGVLKLRGKWIDP